MNEEAIRVLTPLLGQDLARMVTGLTTLAETAAALAQRLEEAQAPSPPTPEGPTDEEAYHEV